ncbi:10735_t:CDS:1 [Dentiscutata heterogama]|uniref:10735_t:CDS:1 n=1 Tax=Dentiscutata heterogama TaxID=1316150 RepID=A0ACA9NBC1_9GLOM|nr:10735_t:CDS:1 [Dentiscutata heterogama]
MSSINILEIALFLVFVCLMIFAEKIPVHLIFIATCFAMYIVRQQLTTELNTRVERLTADITSRDAKFVVEGQRMLTMVNTMIETINEITTNYESLCDQLDHLTETGSMTPLISEQFAVLSVPMCNIVSVEIRSLGVGKLGKETVKSYYLKINDLKSSNLNKIGAWIDSKTNIISNNSE